MATEHNTITLNCKECTGCGACANICPKSAIQLLSDERGFYTPQIDFEKCINCGLCKKVCLIGRKKELETDFVPEVYAAFAKDEYIRRESTSGGIFSVLALETLRKGGIVYGAAFDENFKVVHIGVRQEADLAKLRGSKYVQSFISETLFAEIKEELTKGTQVLFSGTPCQVAGLKLYLQKNYSNLLLVDLICHGVPSPKVFEAYFKHQEEKHGKICSYKFRDKHKSWKHPNIKISTEKKIHHIFYGLDYFINLFGNSTVRESCYQCEFANRGRISDITIGDYWGYIGTEKMPDDDKGMSCVICNTSHGRIFFCDISEQLTFERHNLTDIEKGNPRLLFPREFKKTNFWEIFLQKDFSEVEKLCFPIKLKNYLSANIRVYFPRLHKLLKKIRYFVKK